MAADVRRVTMVAMATKSPMGQQLYETEIMKALERAGASDGWDVRRETVASWRAHLPGVRRYPQRLVKNSPLPLALGIGTFTYRARGLIHRLDLRLPPTLGSEVITIHDLPPLRYHDEGSIPRSASAGARRAAAVICPSSFAAEEVHVLLGATRISVIPYGLSDLYVRPNPMGSNELSLIGVRRPFILHAAGATERKNLRGLAEAWRLLANSHPDHSLVLCGPKDRRRDLLFGELPRTRLLGAVAPVAVAALMKAAEAVVVPSLYEGFGLPALEGMACGVPVVAARAGALPEVCGDGALLVEPTPTGLAEGLRVVLAGGKVDERLRRSGPARAKTFSWEKAARAHLACYSEAIG